MKRIMFLFALAACLIAAASVNGGASATEPYIPPVQCHDGEDNDGDQWVDMQDPGCTDQNDDDEYNAPPPPPPPQPPPPDQQGEDEIDNDILDCGGQGPGMPCRVYVHCKTNLAIFWGDHFNNGGTLSAGASLWCVPAATFHIESSLQRMEAPSGPWVNIDYRVANGVQGWPARGTFGYFFHCQPTWRAYRYRVYESLQISYGGRTNVKAHYAWLPGLVYGNCIVP